MLHAYRTGAMSVGAASSEARSINENRLSYRRAPQVTTQAPVCVEKSSEKICRTRSST
jgi:hypothetical protein